MPEEILPHQKEQLTNWSIQRDALLSEISLLTEEKNAKTKSLAELAVSRTEMEMSIEKAKGRMEELDKQELLYIEIVDSRLPQLEKRKSELESNCTSLSVICDELEIVKSKLQKDIEFLTTTYKEVFERTGILREVVEHVTKVSSSNVKEIETVVSSLTEKTKEYLSLSDTNIKAHTDILNEIPKLFVELSRQTLTRQKI